MARSLVLLVMFGTAAHADVLPDPPDRHADPDSDHALGDDMPDLSGAYLGLGLELTGGQLGAGFGFRGSLGFDHAFGHGALRPAIGGGLTIGAGRAGTSLMKNELFDVGPQLELALRTRNDNRVFVTFAVLDTTVGASSSIGARFAFGGNWVRAIAASRERANEALYLLPHQIELVLEREGGDARAGVALSYGF